MVGSDSRGRVLNAFENPEDVKMISAGYACGNCCATFYTFQLECPVCRLATNVSGQVESAPQEWQDHVDQRHADVPTLGPGDREPLDVEETFRPRNIDEFLAAAAADGDIEQIPLSKLKSRPRG